MRIRTKLWIGAGLLLLAAGAVIVRSFPEGPAVEVRFVRYMEDETSAVLRITNRSRSSILCTARNARLFPEKTPATSDLPTFLYLEPRSSTQFIIRPVSLARIPRSASPSNLPAKVSVFCLPDPSGLRYRIQGLLGGISILSTGFVATVTLPPPR